jgi:hypothetical protein
VPAVVAALLAVAAVVPALLAVPAAVPPPLAAWFGRTLAFRLRRLAISQLAQGAPSEPACGGR